MYSQIFVRTRRYHSSSRRSSLGVAVSPYACFFLHPPPPLPFEGGIHFAAQRPRLRSIASIILTLFLDPLPRSSILVSSDSSRLLTPYSPLLVVEIYRPGCRWHPPKSGMSRFYSWLKTASWEIGKKEEIWCCFERCIIDLYIYIYI